MSKKRGPYKEYLATGDSPTKSTMYDNAKRQKMYESSGSSTDDMEEYYEMMDKKLKKIPNSPCHNEKLNSSTNERDMPVGIPLCSSPQFDIDHSQNIVDSSARNEQFHVDPFMTVELDDTESDFEKSNTEISVDGDFNDSEDEDGFWEEVEPINKIKNKLDDGELDQIKTAKIVVSTAEMLCAIVKYSEHFTLPTTGIEQLCKMFNSFFDKPVLEDTRYSLDNILRSYDVVEFHAVCIKCNRYLRAFKSNEYTVFCNKCKSNVSVKGNNANFFVILNIRDTFRHLLETNQEYYDRFLRNKNIGNENCQDITDG